ncbi:hypothetical protein VOLCADRAFT_100579 [Volvox carteri f. nagariensis]|uniref:Uncharacterized protein n=1 Tax=Volvox carteri f. nagariensis TaxID=3068 RepID=D8UKJ3_VOLCA|nr:uncharacterized protein VOLCADRAFT_100579 [Volvox carteri f. nagariensis]EFJ39769.1 hypothetical protein VOLCADRAFT_100579 [Volvox carteri f. nagariensis]|eukprot:XP_002959179.1 hypothetical protein VOLCADRAFT_100579 [Volvox carteri f. nagariensis]
MPNSERQVRPLTALPPCDALGAWRLAVARSEAESRLLSGRLVEQCALEVTGRSRLLRGTGSDNSSSEMDISDSESGEGVNMVRSRGGGNVRLFLSSESPEWFTPLSIIELVREVFTPGRIDLDPCSSAAANTRVGATVYYDMESDGLLECNAWMGNVFVNPPFGVRGGASYQSLFFQRCATEYTAGRIHQAVLLLKSAVGYAWFDAILQWPVCFLRQRLAFVRGQSGSQQQEGGPLTWGARVANPHGSVVVYMGPDVQRFVSVFGCMGGIPGATSWAMPLPVESSMD